MLAVISDTGWDVIGTVLLASVNVIGAIAIAMLQRQGAAIRQVEHQTNAMKDELVAFNREKGREEGRLREVDRQEKQDAQDERSSEIP